MILISFLNELKSIQLNYIAETDLRVNEDVAYRDVFPDYLVDKAVHSENASENFPTCIHYILGID